MINTSVILPKTLSQERLQAGPSPPAGSSSTVHGAHGSLLWAEFLERGPAPLNKWQAAGSWGVSSVCPRLALTGTWDPEQIEDHSAI